jgi:hypothetical protein
MNEPQPSQRQLAYLRYLISQAHPAGVPYLPIEHLHPEGVTAWIEYLDLLVHAHWNIQRDLAKLREAQTAQEAADDAAAPYLVTPAREQLPESYRAPWQELPPADDHEHLVGSVKREDGVEQTVCVLCGVSA